MSSAHADGASPSFFSLRTNRPSTIRQKLLRSHLAVAAVGVCLLVASLFSTIWLRVTTVHLAEARGASEHVSMRALSGLHRSEAALRAWVVGGNSAFQQQRKAAWSEEIRPAIEQLHSLSVDWRDEERLRIETLLAVLNRLQDAQWWVEEVARTPGNEPAKDVFLRDIQPLETSIADAVSEVIEIGKDRHGEPGLSRLMGRSADFRSTFTQASGRFSEFVTSGDAITRDEFWRYFNRASENLKELDREQGPRLPEQQELVVFIQEELPALRHHAERVIALRERDDWDVARYRLRTEVDLLARQADGLLTEISRKEHALMLQEAEQATTISGTAISISMCLIVFMLGVAWFLSDRGAARIAQPMKTLTSGLEEIAAGRRTSTLPLTRDDELGRLTHAFNTMATALQGSEARLETVYKTTKDGIITIDEYGTIQSTTNIAGAMFGYSSDELVGNNVSMLMPSPYRENHDRYLADFVRTGDAKIIDIGRELVGQRKNGETFPIYLSVSELRLPNKRFFTGIVSDISRRKQAEVELFNLGRILDEAINEIYVFDASTMKFLYVNRGAQTNLQYTMDELRALSPNDLKPEHTRETFATLVAPLRTGERAKIVFETIHLRKDGTTYPVEVHLQTSRFEDHDVFIAIILDITARKQAEKDVWRLAQVFTDSVDAIMIKDLTGNIVEVNAATERQYGWTRDELVGHSFKRLVPPEEHEQRDELMARCMRGEEVRGMEVSRVTKSGEVLPVLLTLSLLTDKAGQPMGIATISEDISRQKAAEEELRASESRFRSAFDDAAVAMSLQDVDGHFLRVNPSMCRLVGYTAQELLAKTYKQITHPDDREVDHRIDTSLLDGTRNFHSGQEKRYIHKSGRLIWALVSASIVADEVGHPLYRVVQVQDITERKHAEEALRENEQRLRSIVETASDPIITINKRGTVESFNPAAERTFNYSADELIGQNVKMLMPMPYHEEHDGYLARYLQTGEPRIIGVGREVIGRRKNGTTFPAQLAVSEVEQLGIFTGIIRDLTYEKRSQQRLLQSERLAAIGEAMAGLVHESRNAMASVQAQLRMLSRRITDRPELAQYIDGALKSQLEVQTLFEEVRQWAAPKKLEIKPCNLGELLRCTWEKLEPQRAGRTADLHEQHGSVDLTCEADEFSLAQVFRNIFENALAACEDPVEVEAEYSEVHAAGRPALRLIIRDNGPGLSAEQRERIFDAFYTTKTQGTGLGMPIAKRAIQAHGGDIEIGPKTSGGAEMILIIPRKQS